MLGIIIFFLLTLLRQILRLVLKMFLSLSYHTAWDYLLASPLSRAYVENTDLLFRVDQKKLALVRLFQLHLADPKTLARRRYAKVQHTGAGKASTGKPRHKRNGVHIGSGSLHKRCTRKGVFNARLYEPEGYIPF